MILNRYSVVKKQLLNVSKISDVQIDYCLYIGGYNRNKLATTNPILRKWVQFRVGTIPSEPFLR